MSSRFLEEARVAFRRDVGDGYFVLGLEAPRIAATVQPGQFCMVSVRPPGAPGHDPLLPRPFTFLRAHGGLVELFLRSVGRGTVLLSRSHERDHFTVLGPLGKGYLPPKDPAARPLFVAGGIGVAPFLHFAEKYSGTKRPVLLYGGRSVSDLHLQAELGASMDLEMATEDGSFGTKGRVTDLLARRLADGEKYEIYTCGPAAMMAAVTKLCAGRPIQASLEARMACGIGVCRGCAVPVASGGYIEVCVDGPVQDGHVIWG